MEHFIEYDSNGPDVAFMGVRIAFQGLWTHIEWSTYVVGWFFMDICKGAEAEISNFALSIVNKYIRRL